MDGLIWAVIAFVVICTLSAQGLLGNVIGAILVIVAGIGVCIFIGKLLKKKRERTPAINRVNKDRRTNIELLVNDIIRKNNLLQGNYEYVRVGARLLTNDIWGRYTLKDIEKRETKLIVTIKPRNGAEVDFPLEENGYHSDNVSHLSIDAIADCLHQALPNSYKEIKQDSFLYHFNGGGSITGISSTGTFNYTSSEGSDQEVQTFYGYEILTRDVYEFRKQQQQQKQERERAKHEEFNRRRYL